MNRARVEIRPLATDRQRYRRAIQKLHTSLDELIAETAGALQLTIAALHVIRDVPPSGTVS